MSYPMGRFAMGILRGDKLWLGIKYPQLVYLCTQTQVYFAAYYLCHVFSLSGTSHLFYFSSCFHKVKAFQKIILMILLILQVLIKRGFY